MKKEEIKKLFGYNLKRLRKQRKISQIQLALQIDMGFPFISDIETGKKWVSPETIEKLAQALNVEVYQFFLPSDFKESKDKSVESFSTELIDTIKKLKARYR